MLAKFLTLLPFVALASCASVSHKLARRSSFDPSEHLGNLSPYFAAPVPFGMSTELPADCTVDQVMLVCLPLFLRRARTMSHHAHRCSATARASRS